MKNILRIIMIAALCLIVQTGFSQGLPKDTVKESMPTLEIPEITIVGKKAITLPFARKGELHEVNIYNAPPPDSSLFAHRPLLPISSMQMPKYGERLSPLHISVDGSLGSFSTGQLQAFVDYRSQDLELGGNGGYATTNGHTTNSSFSSGTIDFNTRTILRTDNDLLKRFLVSGGLQFKHDTYGMFGITSSSVERRRDQVAFSGELASPSGEHNTIDLSVAAKIWNVHDVGAGADSEASTVSPSISAVFATGVKNVQLTTGIYYSSSSLDYSVSTQTPSVFNLSGGARWYIAGNWSLDLGVVYSAGSDVQGEGRTLFSPTAKATWKTEPDCELSFWWRPEQQLLTYDEFARRNPYLVREIMLRPQRMPVNVGSSFRMTAGLYTLELIATYAQSSNKEAVVANNGRLGVEFVEADQTTLQFNGTLQPVKSTRLTVDCTIQPAHEKGSTTQLPMVPLTRLNGRAELDLPMPATAWSAIDFWSNQNVDRQGVRQLGNVLLFHAGVSTSILPRTLFSFEVKNLFNTSYEWWSGYIAPGRQLMVQGKINLE